MIVLVIRASLVAQTVKNLPAMQESGVRSLSWEDPLEKGTATHSSILAWRFPWTEGPGGLQSLGSDTAKQVSLYSTMGRHAKSREGKLNRTRA